MFSKLTTVQVDHHLQARTLGPIQCLAQHLVRALHEGFAVNGNHAPVSERNPHVVQPSCRHLVEVVLRDPAVPVI